MPGLVEHLRRLDRKERFAVLRDALGFHCETPEIDDGFRRRLGKCIGVVVPERVFLAMDYHLDWIQLALYLAANPVLECGEPFPKPEFGDINRDQEDIDVLIAFEDEDCSQTVTHLVLVEAKAYLPWTNRQLDSKAERLQEIFGDGGKAHESVKPHFALMTQRCTDKIKPCAWPCWMLNDGELPWLQYSLPTRTKVTRCTDSGRRHKDGSHLRLDPVPKDRVCGANEESTSS